MCEPMGGHYLNNHSSLCFNLLITAASTIRRQSPNSVGGRLHLTQTLMHQETQASIMGFPRCSNGAEMQGDWIL